MFEVFRPADVIEYVRNSPADREWEQGCSQCVMGAFLSEQLGDMVQLTSLMGTLWKDNGERVQEHLPPWMTYTVYNLDRLVQGRGTWKLNRQEVLAFLESPGYQNRMRDA